MSSTKKKKKKLPELKVVFDTNALFSGSASDLLNSDVAQLIRENSSHQDLVITWCLPSVVRHERQYQMELAALKLLPSIQKLERVLGHNLNITEGVIRHRIDEVVETQLKDFGLQIVDLVIGDVDWQRVALDAAYRRPPFEAGEHEKGFRDALIVETFLQVLQHSPSTPTICRVALSSGDALLRTAVANRTSDRTNVRVLEGLDELKDLINTLVAKVTEDFVAKIREGASALFFTEKDPNSIYYKEKVGERLRETFVAELKKLPAGAQRREGGGWYIIAPRFVKKEGQRVHWVTAINTEAKAFTIPSTVVPGAYGELLNILSGKQLLSPSLGSSYLGSLGASVGAGMGSGPNLTVGQALGTLANAPERQIAKGTSIFEVSWSVLVSTAGKFRDARIDDLKFIRTTWE